MKENAVLIENARLLNVTIKNIIIRLYQTIDFKRNTPTLDVSLVLGVIHPRPTRSDHVVAEQNSFRSDESNGPSNRSTPVPDSEVLPLVDYPLPLRGGEARFVM